MSKKPDIAFFGDFTAFTAGHLSACLNAGHRIAVFVRTRKLRESNRRMDRILKVVAPRWSVAAILQRNRIPQVEVDLPVDGAECMERLAPFSGQVLVSVGFPGRIPAAVRSHFPAGAINVHPAMLPLYRGPHPGYAMVLDGKLEEGAGITIHALTDEFDEGPVFAQEHLQIARPVDLQLLEVGLTHLGASVLCRVLGDLPAYAQAAKEQPKGQFPRGSITLRDITIESGIDRPAFDRIMELCAMQLYPRVLVGGKAVIVTKPVSSIGNATTMPATSTATYVELDVGADRVRVKRARKWIRTLDRWRWVFVLFRSSVLANPDQETQSSIRAR